MKNKIIKTYAKLKSKLNKVTYKDLAKVDPKITKSAIKHHCFSITHLDKMARELYPHKFYDISIKSVLTPQKIQDFNTNISKKNKFIITTAAVGCKVDVKFLASIETYCKKNNAELLILLAADPASIDGDWTVDKEIANKHIIPRDISLNSNLFLSTIKLTTKQINPITGLNRIGQRSGSFIYASPKQFLKYVPVSNTKMPHAIMTTGAITFPDYAPKGKEHRYMSERTAYIANHDHVMGAIVVEIENDKFFHFRQVQADKNGQFIDLAVQYSGSSAKKIRPEAFIMGDWHSGQTDPTVAKCWKDVCKTLKPKRVIFHDAFDGLSINHHEAGNNILKARRAGIRKLNLKDELKRLATDLSEFTYLVDNVVIVKSNHDEFLQRYLQAGMYVKDPENHLIGLELAIQSINGIDPLKYAVMNLGLKNPNKVVWLQRDQDYKIAGVQCGAHGDKGPNGARGSLMAMEMAYGFSITGHSHTAGIIRNAIAVGTSSLMDLGYNVGPSSWTHTGAFLYPNGSFQLINVINNKWKM